MVIDRAASRITGLAGHCYRHAELPASKLVVWEPAHAGGEQGVDLWRPSSMFLNRTREWQRPGS